MKAYVITSGTVFLLTAAAHAARVFAEGPRLLKEPWFVLTTILALGLAVWAWQSCRQLSNGMNRSRSK